MYFPEEPELLTEAVIRGKKETYDSPGTSGRAARPTSTSSSTKMW
jgi:hypothetical protein